MKNRPLVSQFRITFVFIIAASIAASLITYAVTGVLFLRALNSSEIRPENYYEQQIPDIENYIRRTGAAVLSKEGEKGLENVFPDEGLSYQGVDSDGNILYGTYQRQLFENREQLFSCLNKTFRVSGDYIQVVPVISSSGKIEGAVSIAYKLSLFAANKDKVWLFMTLLIIVLSPFIYVIVFTILFSRVFTNRITRPLKLLMEGSRQIREKNLDFHIDYHADNELGELCEVFSDMKEELRESLSVQWKLEQERVEMVEALAHDLKSPLSVIKAYSEAVLDDTEVDEEQRQYLAVIEENIEKSISLVQQMQYTSDLDNSSVTLEKVCVNLYDFLEQKVHQYELQARQKEITVTLSIQGDLPDHVLTDRDKLERILDNIVSNSLQYTPAGGMVTLSVREEENTVFYQISDSGIGFSAKDLDKVFGKFYRGDEARQTRNGHSGLGLYIVKQLAELLGGSAAIENSEGGGACVKFWHGH
ncbi:sensor histidine kinase [Ruminococcus gauvreauii]|uniref:sensor histidine kinase n=1 Tax=Ruminococcus gauvreauii TaxID=438033 RepID=UPI003983F87C